MKKLITILILAVVALTTQAQTVWDHDTKQVLTNGNFVSPLATTNAVTNAVAVDVYPGQDLSISLYGNTTNSAANDTINFSLFISLDRTNFTTVNAKTIAWTANGTTAVRSHTVIPWTNIAGAKQVKLGYATNTSTNTIWFTNGVRGTWKQIIR